ncbi:MAG: STAS domain-containing protein [Spirochaetales bacterium]|nr:STAS domain-containing protein [Spirochaetales bacterium]
MSEALYFQETSAGIFIKAVGHITAALSVDLKAMVTERLEQTPVPLELFADLSECTYMDSTFMGLLVGFHKKLKSLTGRSLTLWNPSRECEKLLQGLGIWKLMRLVEGRLDSGEPDFWKLVTKTQDPSPEILLGAHQNLSEISTENAKKFSVLESILKDQIHKEEE